jgi:general secretion pathway protein G
MMNVRKSKAFTLVEILIVVVILGILAAIVVPQFTRASEDAQTGNVVTQLQTVRSQIELFRVRNNGNFPGLTAGVATGNFGWDALIGANFMRAAPINPRTGTGTIVDGTAAPTAAVATGDAGWVYDAATGELWANGFNETTRTWIAP